MAVWVGDLIREVWVGEWVGGWVGELMGGWLAWVN